MTTRVYRRREIVCFSAFFFFIYFSLDERERKKFRTGSVSLKGFVFCRLGATFYYQRWKREAFSKKVFFYINWAFICVPFIRSFLFHAAGEKNRAGNTANSITIFPSFRSWWLWCRGNFKLPLLILNELVAISKV